MTIIDHVVEPTEKVTPDHFTDADQMVTPAPAAHAATAAHDPLAALRDQLAERLTALRAEQERRLAELNALAGRIAECADTLALLGHPTEPA